MSIKNKIKQYGLWNSLKLFLKSIFRFVGIRFESFWIIENNLSLDEISRKMSGFDYSDVKELKVEDFKNGDPLYFNNVKLEEARERFESGGYWSFGIYNQEKLVYSCWITTLKISFRQKYNTSIQLLEDEGYLEDSYCHPDYRGKGIHSKMNLFRIMSLCKKGKTRNFVVVQIENIPAIKTQLKSGFIIAKKVTFLILLGKQYVFETIQK